AEHGHTDIVKFLINHKANADATDNYGITPLHEAAECGHTDIVKLLIENKANVNALDRYGKTPLYYVIDLKTKLLLLRNIAELEISNPDIIYNVGFQKNKKIIENDERFWPYYEKHKKKIQELKQEYGELYQFFQDTKIDNLVKLWCKHQSIRDQEELKDNWKKYPKDYVSTLFCNYGKVKKHIFIENNKHFINYLFDCKNKELQNMLYDELVDFIRKKETEFQSKISKTLANVSMPRVNIVNYDISKLVPKTLYQMSLIAFMRKVDKEEKEEHAKVEKEERDKHAKNKKIGYYSSISLAAFSLVTYTVCAAIGLELLPAIGVALSIGLLMAIVTAGVMYYVLKPDMCTKPDDNLKGVNMEQIVGITNVRT
ncbi:ankyrin repeat domain-containing protein, partial [Wolbachia endosymbiont of Pentidionis agamae]|uniref:ankyrin repeat domain-containing protein n=1 Tax=Wolbachia endosymbiont of Pentidionis agamae TaxID=3110435 RepID=UPI002FD641FC